jgi:hypothetical protein
MAVWTLRGGEPGRAGPRLKSAAMAGCIAVLAMIWATSSTAHAQDAVIPNEGIPNGVIYVNAPQRSSGPALVATLRQSLAGLSNYTVSDADKDQDILQRVAADPRNIGFVQRDHYVQYLRDHSDSDARFEFYGNIAACLMVVVRKGAQIHTYGDLVRARADRPTTLDVGPATAQLAATFENLRQIDRSLAGLAPEHRGGARALGRVITGETDAALFLVLAPFADGLTAEVIGSDALDLVPFFSEDIVSGAARRKMPYMLRQIRLGTAGWFAAGRPYHTTCTSVGAVVNAQADVRLSEKVAQILLSDAAARVPAPWYAVVGNVFAAAVTQVESLVLGSVEMVAGWLGFGAPEVQAPNIREVSDRPSSTTSPRAPIASAP